MICWGPMDKKRPKPSSRAGSPFHHFDRFLLPFTRMSLGGLTGLMMSAGLPGLGFCHLDAGIVVYNVLYLRRRYWIVVGWLLFVKGK